MFDVNIEQLVPRFIMQDKNGYAVAKAIEAGLQIMNDTVNDGVKCVTDADTMPEWRLDELAWEYNLLYDYTASIEQKRAWIKDAPKMYALYGTPEGIIAYLRSIYDVVSIDEWWAYNGSPFHFNVSVSGLWSPENEAWTMKAIRETKNLRSVLDNVAFNSAESNATYYTGYACAGQELEVESVAI